MSNDVFSNEIFKQKELSKTLGFIFPGQGSQSVGMLANFVQYPIIQQTFAEASTALGFDLWQLVQEGPAEKLNQTQHTQPALLTASVALWRLWLSEKSTLPALLAGHSLGEYSALVCAQALSLADAVNLVALRGRLMQEAVPEGLGAMAAILGLDNDQVEAICLEARAFNEIVDPANYNAIGQVVIAGNVNAVLRAIEIAKVRGARAIRLPVSVPSHCELMKPAALKLEQALKKIDFKLPILPLIHNVDVSEHTSIDSIRNVLVNQLYMPVRWVETIEKMATKGITTVVECGPGAVLSGLNKRITSDLRSVALSNGVEAYADK